MSTMSAKTFKNFVKSFRKPVLSWLLRADHAMGKSSIIKELAVEMDAFFIDLRLGQRDLGDVLGMPVVYTEEGRQKFDHITPEIIYPAFVKSLTELGTIGDKNDIIAKARPKSSVGKQYKNIFLFFDELNRATKDVQQSVFEIILDRRMSGKHVHENCYIFSAINHNLDTYTVTEMDPALITRFSVIDFKPTSEEWLEWAKANNINPIIYNTLKNKPAFIDPPDKKDSELLTNPHPNRRSWHKMSDWMNENKIEFTSEEMITIYSSFVGPEAAKIIDMLSQKTSTNKVSAEKEKTKAANLIDGFFVKGSLTKNVFAKEVELLNSSELHTFSDSLASQINAYEYTDSKFENKFYDMMKSMSEEITTKTWNLIENTKFKNKIISIAKTKSDYEFLETFSK